MFTNVPEVASFIVKLVSESFQQSASGTRVAVAIKQQFPSFLPTSVGCRSFREFIRTRVPQVGESSQRAGLDVIYVLKQPEVLRSTQESKPPETPPKTSGFISLLLNDPRAWKTFANPSSTSNIYVKSDATEVVVSSSRVMKAEDGWAKVTPISADTLLEIAKDFVALVPDLYQPALTESLQKPKWWIPYFEVMGSLGLKSRWVTFRRRRILDEFSKVVANSLSGNSSSSVSAAPVLQVSKLGDTPRARTQPAIKTWSLVSTESKEEKLRKLAMYAVQHMSIAELRELAIPLGSVIDSLEES